jgi:hypothetical protein
MVLWCRWTIEKLDITNSAPCSRGLKFALWSLN